MVHLVTFWKLLHTNSSLWFVSILPFPGHSYRPPSLAAPLAHKHQPCLLVLLLILPPQSHSLYKMVWAVTLHICDTARNKESDIYCLHTCFISMIFFSELSQSYVMWLWKIRHCISACSNFYVMVLSQEVILLCSKSHTPLTQVNPMYCRCLLLLGKH